MMNFINTLKDIWKIEELKEKLLLTLGLIAANEAINDSGFVTENENSYRFGVMVGSGIGGLDTIYRNSSILDNQGLKKISPFCSKKKLFNILILPIFLIFKLLFNIFILVSDISNSIYPDLKYAFLISSKLSLIVPFKFL